MPLVPLLWRLRTAVMWLSMVGTLCTILWCNHVRIDYSGSIVLSGILYWFFHRILLRIANKGKHNFSTNLLFIICSVILFRRYLNTLLKNNVLVSDKGHFIYISHVGTPLLKGLNIQWGGGIALLNFPRGWLYSSNF